VIFIPSGNGSSCATRRDSGRVGTFQRDENRCFSRDIPGLIAGGDRPIYAVARAGRAFFLLIDAVVADVDSVAERRYALAAADAPVEAASDADF